MSITLNGTTGVTTSGLTSNGIDDNATSTAITIDASENVGIGTAAPSFPLSVQSNSSAEGLLILGRSSDDIGEIAFRENDNSTALGELQYRQDHAILRHRVGDLRFATGGTSERMRITSAGSVGINTTSSDSYYAKKLVVDCGTDGQNGITIKSSTTGAGMFAFADGTSGSDRYRGYINYNHANDSMTLGTAGGAGILTIDATGAVTMPTQPAFQAHKNGSDQSNLAVGNDVYVTWTHEAFDQNSDFSLSANSFTAPVTGKYQLNLMIRLENLESSSAYYVIRITTSNQSYSHIVDPDYGQDNVYYPVQISILADMDANDTAFVVFNQQSGPAQTEIDGNREYTTFSGYLVA